MVLTQREAAGLSLLDWYARPNRSMARSFAGERNGRIITVLYSNPPEGLPCDLSQKSDNHYQGKGWDEVKTTVRPREKSSLEQRRPLLITVGLCFSSHPSNIHQC